MEKLNQTSPKLQSSALATYLLMLFFIFSSCSPEENSFSNDEAGALDLKAPVNFETWEDQIDWLTQKTTRFHNFQVALAQGWNVDATGYRAYMGHHYINMTYVDDKFELEKPEMLIYVPDEDGVMQFVGVEYLVFVEGETPPEGFIGSDDEWSFNSDIGAWTLHAWVGLTNEDGVFKPLNYKLPEFLGNSN